MRLDVAFTLRAPWTVLFGPSGSGKTTILRLVQGLERPDSGRVLLRGKDVSGLAAHLRPVRSAAQTPRLFPRMMVGENLAWGAKGAALEEVLRLFRLEPLAGKRPAALSGGERQRVAVARAVLAALATKDALLLLDEPFTGFDMALRDEVLPDLRSYLRQRQVPVLSVTHDIGEAFLLEAEVVRLAEGRIVEQGPVERVLARERERLAGLLMSSG